MRLPGLIDPHVHVRDLNQSHKEDWTTATAAALAGGVTTILAMPNTQPPLVDGASLTLYEKAAKAKAVCDYGIFLGAGLHNAAAIAVEARRGIGLKLYLDATFGDLKLPGLDALVAHFDAWPKDRPIVAHAEEQQTAAVILAAQLAGRGVHICHVARRAEIELIRRARERGLNVTCEGCPHHDPVGAEVLLINLDAMGDVLRTTALLPAIKRSLPDSRITWLTLPRAMPLLAANPLIDRVLPFDLGSTSELLARRFDLLLCVDKSGPAGGLAMRVPAVERRGFGIDGRGVITPLNPQAEELYALGLDDELKFRGNRKAETQLLCEAMGFYWSRDPYTLNLSPAERSPAAPRRVGFNTGCS
ncbi:MAG TPA: amidohydrolase family protein, partial [Anaerolineales bacterium]|nr:amidohydrolase family protein [Anaerolineales bacterium]